MLWMIAVVLIILWMLGLVTGFTAGSFIHIIFAAAVALLVVSLSQEAMINQKMRRVMRNRGANPDGKRMRERLADQPAPSRSMP
jgi:nitrogen fixation/metabolism regulation signal transduction histidine kinase